MKPVIIDHTKFGVEESKAKTLHALFVPMLNKMLALDEEAQELLKKDVNKETCKEARILRLKVVKTRTGTAGIHRELKAESLRIGKMLDGWKSTQSIASKEIEEKLAAIEKHFENVEKERINKLQVQRAIQAGQYSDKLLPNNLGEMDGETWNNYILGAKASFEAKKEAARAEAERIEKERLDDLEFKKEQRRITAQKEQERKELEAENTKLKDIAAKKEAKRIKEENKRIAAKKVEREARDKKEQENLAEFDAILAKEREEKEKLKAELKAKKAAENKEEADKVEAERKAAAAPDKEKLLAFGKQLIHLELPSVTTQHGEFMLELISILLLNVENYIIEASEKF